LTHIHLLYFLKIIYKILIFLLVISIIKTVFFYVDTKKFLFTLLMVDYFSFIIINSLFDDKNLEMSYYFS